MVDELDSRVNSIFKLMANELENSNHWTNFNAQYDRYFYLSVLQKKLTELKTT